MSKNLTFDVILTVLKDESLRKALILKTISYLACVVLSLDELRGPGGLMQASAHSGPAGGSINVIFLES